MPLGFFGGGSSSSLGDEDKKKKKEKEKRAGKGGGGGYPGNAYPGNAYPGNAYSGGGGSGGVAGYTPAPLPQQQQQSAVPGQHAQWCPPPLPARASPPQQQAPGMSFPMPYQQQPLQQQPPYPYQPSQPTYPSEYAGHNPPGPPGPPPPAWPLGGNPNYPQPPGSLHNPYGAPYSQGQPDRPSGEFTLHQSGNYQPPPPQGYQLSNCTGRKRALLIGINYFGTKAQLKGCINDVQNLKRFINSHYGFREEDMVVLTDDQKDPTRVPNRANIIAAMRWLVNDARPNDSFFLHFSGHGTSVADKDGDEDDGYDEAICPVDYKTAGLIIDDEIHAIVVAPLPPGVRLTSIFDSCHSGSCMDLPYIYSTTGELKTNTSLKESGRSLISAVPDLLMGNKLGALMSIGSSVLGAAKGRGAEKRARATRTSPADVIMFSGCKDSQTSADANIQGGATGAMSYAFRTALEINKNVSYQQLLIEIREILRKKYSQLPQLSSSHPMDMRLMFIM